MIAAFGHHKCASMWVHSICEQACLDMGLKVETVFGEREFDGDLERHLAERNPDFLLYGEADFAQVQRLPMENLRGFHYVRDPRDIVVSAYFSHRNSHSTEAWSELVAYRDKLRSCTKEEGLFLELDFRAEQFEQMRSWRGCPEEGPIKSYRIEEVTSNPYRSMLDIFRFLGLLDEAYYSPSNRLHFLLAKSCRKVEAWARQSVRLPMRLKTLPAERVLGIVYDREFSKLSGGRQKGQSDPNSHYRKGVHGDWVNHFSTEHLQYFKERYGDLVLHYGYETDPDWDRNYLPIIQDRLNATAATT